MIDLREIAGEADANIRPENLCNLLRTLGFAERIDTAIHLWPMTTIEEALGSDASLVLPPASKT